MIDGIYRATVPQQRPASGVRGRRVSDGRADNWLPNYAGLNSGKSAAESIKVAESAWRMPSQPQDSRSRMNGYSESYPERPGQIDCAHYMRTGFCGYGMNCRYNHPINMKQQAARNKGELPERVGHNVCQFYMKTGTCKFGATCKYHHPRDRLGAGQVQLNMAGLPMRMGEKECTYYIRTGYCKYGASCKYDHPQPASLGPLVRVSGSPLYASVRPPIAPASVTQYSPGLPTWPSHRTPYRQSPHMPGALSYMPVMYSPQQGMLTASGWGTYQGPVSPMTSPESQQQLRRMNIIYNSTQPNGLSVGGVQGLTTPFAQGSSAAVGHQPGHFQPNRTQTETHPERPGQPECQYYIKTGDCKFGFACRYHHPRERVSQSSTCVLSPIGLPLRPTQPTCTYYSHYGICKFGPTCKFDHPMAGLSYSPSASSLSEIPVAPYPRGSSPTATHVQSPEPPQEIAKSRDQLLREPTSSKEDSDTVVSGNTREIASTYSDVAFTSRSAQNTLC